MPSTVTLENKAPKKRLDQGLEKQPLPTSTEDELSSLMQKLSINDPKAAAPEKAPELTEGVKQLGQLYLLLLTEQLGMKDTKAKDLYTEIQGITDKTKAIDALLNLLMQKSQASPSGSVDCKSPDIAGFVEGLRQKMGISISLPNGTLKKEDIARTFSLIGNQRQTLDQQIQQKAQAFQQGTMERNQLIEFIKGQFDVLHRIIQRITNGFTNRTA